MVSDNQLNESTHAPLSDGFFCLHMEVFVMQLTIVLDFL